MRLRHLALLAFLILLILLLAGCGGGGHSDGWVSIPDGKMRQLDIHFREARLACFVYQSGDYAGNLECHRAGPRRATETITVLDNGQWTRFSAGKVRMIALAVRGQLNTCLQYDHGDRGSIDCPDELNRR